MTSRSFLYHGNGRQSRLAQATIPIGRGEQAASYSWHQRRHQIGPLLATERNNVMFDFSKLTDTVFGLLGGATSESTEQSGGIRDLLQQAGLDPSLLEGLDQTQIFELLSQHGIDPSQLGADQINELARNFGVSEHITSVASDWLGGGKS